jgi:hypothetical protein
MSNIDTSIANLRKTIWFLLLVAAIGCITSVIFVTFAPGNDSGSASDDYTIVLSRTVVLIGFLGAIFIVPIGLWKIAKFWGSRASYFRSELGAVAFAFFPMSVAVMPELLTEQGREIRRELMDALKWVLAGIVLVGIVQLVSELYPVANAA